MAVILACATFPLLFIGGLVTSKGAGLAVPDWPTTFGYNMFLYPWSKMIGNIFYEHSHRLVASCVGLLTIASTLAFGSKSRVPGCAGSVSGARVGYLSRSSWRPSCRLAGTNIGDYSCCFAQAFFALTVSLALFTSKDGIRTESTPITDGGRLSRFAPITTGLIYIQIIFGAC